jgi:uncharacterized membrane protein
MSERIVAEPRWPMTFAVVFVIVLTAGLKERLSVAPRWVFPAGMAILLLALIATDPGAITKRSKGLRMLSISLVGLMVLATLSSTAVLIRDLIEGATETATAGPLLESGASIWVVNVVAFALLYWQFDCGGAAARAHGMPAHPDFAFPQQLSPEIAAPDWRPQFVDYLYVGVTTAVAFSPTDTMPLARWAKLTMAVQALISLVILGLVIARAVNVLQ